MAWEADQNQAYSDGKSRQKWPESAHNYMENGVPCSLALDLFELNEDGDALFPVEIYSKINSVNESLTDGPKWGGNYLTLRDYDHFYINVINNI